jgi:hypothetical protein
MFLTDELFTPLLSTLLRRGTVRCAERHSLASYVTIIIS